MASGTGREALTLVTGATVDADLFHVEPEASRDLERAFEALGAIERHDGQVKGSEFK